MRILSVIGTRPEAIKMAMVVRALAASDAVEHSLCVTAQHREMLDSEMALLELEADYDLDIMTPGQDLTTLTGALLARLRAVLAEARPDRVLVHGDTTTTLAAALAAFYAQIPVAHVEAGLRTADLSFPWPEEMNRRLADALSDRHFAPTARARQNLLAEGLPAAGITVTGNTVIDTLHYMLSSLENEPELVDRARSMSPAREAGRRLILVTGHRRENQGAGLERVCRALVRLAARPDVEIVWPVHLNPEVREPVRRFLGGRPNIHLTGPLDYLSFVYLMREASLVITDSGGIQEEAPSLGKPVLVMREATERQEALAAGALRLVGTDTDRITAEAERLLDDRDAWARMARVRHLYGDGHASERILQALTGD